MQEVTSAQQGELPQAQPSSLLPPPSSLAPQLSSLAPQQGQAHMQQLPTAQQQARQKLNAIRDELGGFQPLHLHDGIIQARLPLQHELSQAFLCDMHGPASLVQTPALMPSTTPGLFQACLQSWHSMASCQSLPRTLCYASSSSVDESTVRMIDMFSCRCFGEGEKGHVAAAAAEYTGSAEAGQPAAIEQAHSLACSQRHQAQPANKERQHLAGTAEPVWCAARCWGLGLSNGWS